MGADTAVVIGRFQPPHDGHTQLIDTARAEYEQVYVGVGSAEKQGEPDNPLPYEMREHLLQALYDDIEVFPVPDQGDDVAWVREVEDRVDVDTFEPVTGNGHTAVCFDAEGYDVRFLGYGELKDRERYSGTVIRERARNGEDWEELVPDPVADVIEEYGGARLMQEQQNGSSC